MDIRVIRVEFGEIAAMRDLYRQGANCQVIRDSMLQRDLADCYLVHVDGRIAGYGGVMNKHNPGRLIEFYVAPDLRAAAPKVCRELIDASGATSMQAQTNIPSMLNLLYEFATDIVVENLLFEDAISTSLPSAGATFRRATARDAEIMFVHRDEPIGDWVLESNGVPVASGGFLTHYNPPYGDIYMEVEESARRRGLGSYLVQELKRVCYAAGKRPAARCDPSNVASRATLERAGMLLCGRVLAGTVGHR